MKVSELLSRALGRTDAGIAIRVVASVDAIVPAIVHGNRPKNVIKATIDPCAAKQLLLLAENGLLVNENHLR